MDSAAKHFPSCHWKVRTVLQHQSRESSLDEPSPLAALPDPGDLDKQLDARICVIDLKSVTLAEFHSDAALSAPDQIGDESCRL